jgi:hypothetical protein
MARPTVTQRRRLAPVHYKRDAPQHTEAERKLVEAAAAAVARVPAPDPPELLQIPAPKPHGKRQLICPVKGCNHRFTKLERYALHFRVAHQEEER